MTLALCSVTGRGVLELEQLPARHLACERLVDDADRISTVCWPVIRLLPSSCRSASRCHSCAQSSAVSSCSHGHSASGVRQRKAQQGGAKGSHSAPAGRLFIHSEHCAIPRWLGDVGVATNTSPACWGDSNPVRCMTQGPLPLACLFTCSVHPSCTLVLLPPPFTH